MMDEFSPETLAHIKAIEHLKARYCRAVDCKQWDALAAVFTEDARFEGFSLAQPDPSVAQFVSALATRLKEAITVHHCHLPDIRLLTSSSAKGVWAMMDFNEWPAAGGIRGFPNANGFCGYGFYEESYRLTKTGWLIEFMRLTRQRLDPLENGARAAGYSPFAVDFHFRRPSLDWLTAP